MDFAFSREQEERYRRFAEFGRSRLKYDVKRAESEGSFPRDAWIAAGREGILGMPFPRDFGGAGLDVVSTVRAWEGLGFGGADPGLWFSLAAHTVAVAVPIWKFGRDAQKTKWLPRLLDGTWIGGGGGEPDPRADGTPAKTRAVEADRGHEITGARNWVVNGPIADLLVVYAAVGPAGCGAEAISPFVLERGAARLRIEPQPARMGLKTSPTARIVLDRVRAEPDERLGAAGAGREVLDASMDWERTLLLAPALGAMQRALETAVQHARAREAAAVPPSVESRIVEMRSRLEAGRLLLYRAAWTLETTGRAPLEARLARRFVSGAWIESSVDLVRILGAGGMPADGDAARQLTAAIPAAITAGPDEAHELALACGLGA